MHYGHEDLVPRTGDGPRRGNSYGCDNVNNEAILIGARRWVSKRRGGEEMSELARTTQDEARPQAMSHPYEGQNNEEIHGTTRTYMK